MSKGGGEKGEEVDSVNIYLKKQHCECRLSFPSRICICSPPLVALCPCHLYGTWVFSTMRWLSVRRRDTEISCLVDSFASFRGSRR